MKAFEKKISVQADDLDDLNHVNNVRYVQWIQDISKEHWQHLTSKELQERFIWVVLNHNITYKNAAGLGDIILLRTYIDNSKGAISVRAVEMYNAKTNALLVHSKTTWCLLNPETLKPIRISEEIRSIFAAVTKNPS
ncbi:thioesterase family protein [uncultured Eudoraea sp.]|uniref:acyl-CoA thioesterase n=1 Tax=uncultured Eudoraea sp. TaxID=1035614 RepID=UPI00263782E7|nr:thioesterase family protein [uncultured Eudoraea sp.]